MKSCLIASALLACSASGLLAASFSATVDGTASVYGAGLGGNGVSTLPVSIALGGGTDIVVSFSSITGTTNCCSGTPTTGPDGTGGTTNVSALNGISGILAPTQMFLVGVFVNSADLPGMGDPAPLTLNYIADMAISDPSYNPLLNQAFFIGDGLTGTGAGDMQSFFAPTGADTLLLGFADSFSFGGAPSYYGDNTGALSVEGLVSSATVPLPAGLPLIAGALVGLVGLHRRRPS